MTADRETPTSGSGDLEGLPSLDLTTHVEKQRRRLRLPPWAIAATSALAGAVAGFVLFSNPAPAPPPQAQQLAGTHSEPSERVAEIEPEVKGKVITRARGDRMRATVKPKVKRGGSKHATVVAPGSAAASSAQGTSPPAPSGSTAAPATQPKKDKKPPKRHEGGQKGEVAHPTATLFHLFRKNGKSHYFTADPDTAQVRRQGDGYKDRLSPGFVYMQPGDGLVKVPVSSDGVATYVYAKDKGDDTYPLWHITGPGGRQFVTSWPEIRDSWVGKGWSVIGTVGYIYRP